MLQDWWEGCILWPLFTHEQCHHLFTLFSSTQCSSKTSHFSAAVSVFFGRITTLIKYEAEIICRATFRKTNIEKISYGWNMGLNMGLCTYFFFFFLIHCTHTNTFCVGIIRDRHEDGIALHELSLFVWLPFAMFLFLVAWLALKCHQRCGAWWQGSRYMVSRQS